MKTISITYGKCPWCNELTRFSPSNIPITTDGSLEGMEHRIAVECRQCKRISHYTVVVSYD